MSAKLRLAIFLVIAAFPTGDVVGQGRGGSSNDEAFHADRELFHYLLEHRDKIRRSVKDLDNGVETVTESDDEHVATKIRAHVASMYKRVAEGRPIHRRDPLFAEIFRHADKIELNVEETKHGVRVTETSENPYAAKLIQAHARVVSLFLKYGHREVRKNHRPPTQQER